MDRAGAVDREGQADLRDSRLKRALYAHAMLDRTSEEAVIPVQIHQVEGEPAQQCSDKYPSTINSFFSNACFDKLKYSLK